MPTESEFTVETEDPVEVLEALIAEWDATKGDHERLAEDAQSGEEARRHRGRAEALQDGIRLLGAADLEEHPLENAGWVWGRLHSRSADVGGLIAERAPLEDKHRAMRSQYDEMLADLNEVRRRLDELLDEDDRRNPEDWMWVDEEIRDRLLAEWGYADGVEDEDED